MKFFVVVSGLVLLVPNTKGESNEIAALLLKDHMHTSAFRQRLGTSASSETAPWTVPDKNFRLVIEAWASREASSEHPPLLSDSGNIISIRDLAPQSTVRSDCLEGDCYNGSTPLVEGVVTLIGDWSGRAAARCEDNWNLSKPPSFIDPIRIDARRKTSVNSHLPSFGQKARATAVVFEVTVEELDQIHISFDGKTLSPLTLESSDVCDDWTEPNEDCAIFEVENWPSSTVVDCGWSNSMDVCRLDEHFSSMFELLNESKRPEVDRRWLPYAARRDSFDCVGRKLTPGLSFRMLNYPALRCPLAYMP